MRTKKHTSRVVAALVGVGAMTAATILPGTLAAAEESGDVTSQVTRAVLSQGDTDGVISRSTLITQVQVDGKGQTSFSVPTVDGGAPKDMDSFGGPEVENGAAQYNLDVDGPVTQRTKQDYDPDSIPVTVDVSATLDGQSIKPSELAGKDGLATLTYTLSNNTAEKTEVKFKDASGKKVSKTMEIPTPMAGTLDFDFDESWNGITSEQSDTVAQNGQGGTTVGATVALMAPPAGSTEASVTIEGRVKNAVVPPADIKVAIIAPLDTGAGKQGKELAEKTGGGLTTLYQDGLTVLADGLEQLTEGLGEAVDGSTQIADGVEDTLGPGIHELRIKASVEGHETAIGASKQLVDTARGESSYQELLGGFDTLNSEKALFKMQDTILKMRPKLGPPFTAMPITGAGYPDMANATVPGSLNAATFGITQKSLDSLGNGEKVKRVNNGITNPKCDMNDPLNQANPCGAVQVLDLALGQVWGGKDGPTAPVGAAYGLSFEVSKACQEKLLACAVEIPDPAGSGKNVPGPNTPGGSAVASLLPQMMFETTDQEPGYQPKPGTAMIGQDQFKPPADLLAGTGLLSGKSILGILNSGELKDGGNPCKVQGEWNPTGAPVGGPLPKPENLVDYPFEPKNKANGKPNPKHPNLGDIQRLFVDCGGVLPSIPLSEIANLAFLSGQFTSGLADSIGTGLKTDGSDSGGTSLRFALGSLRKGFTAEANGWPSGCKPLDKSGKYFKDPYGCNLDAGALGRAMLDDNKYTLTNTMLALQVNLGKTDNNPAGQIKQGSPGWGSKLAFSECPGPKAADSKVEAHCSATQVLQFLAAGISGKDQVKVSAGKIAAGCPAVPSRPWNPPVDGDDKGTVPTPPDADQVERYGATCAVQTLKNSIDRILLPSLGNGVQQQTLELIGSGQYTPNCDPETTPSLTCALSVMDYGVNGPQFDSLKNGTRALADGLPAAEAGTMQANEGVTQQMMPGVDDSVQEANEGAAVLEALSAKAVNSPDIPGGPAEGVDSNQGVYAFEFAGSGNAADSALARFGLGLLILLAAGGLGWFLASRAA